jgi:SAM-dependent methyltransferase
MTSESLRRRALRARHRVTTRALGPVRHLLDERLAPLEERLAAVAPAPEAAAPASPAASPLSGSLLHHALRTSEVARMPRDGVSTLLSAGCAGAWYFEWITEHYGAVDRHIGVEWYSPEPDGLGPEVEWIKNTVGDMSDVADGEADLVFSGQNLEHLSAQDVVAFLGESHRVLRPGGHLVVDSPNRAVTALYGWSHPEHTIELTPSEAAELITLAGFDVRHVRGMWRCVTATGETLPFDTADPEQQILRTQSAVDDPDAAFLWWVEAERTERAPDLDAVARRLAEIYAVAWPEACNRLRNEVGNLVERDGTPWVEVPAGLHGAAVCGPPTALVPGDWTVRFAVEPAADAADDDVPCRIAVRTLDGRDLGAIEPTAAELRAASEVTVGFTTGPGFVMGVEFRVEALGGPAFAARRAVDTTFAAPAAAV